MRCWILNVSLDMVLMVQPMSQALASWVMPRTWLSFRVHPIHSFWKTPYSLSSIRLIVESWSFFSELILEAEVDFEIDTLPIIAPMAKLAVDKLDYFGLFEGESAETSGTSHLTAQSKSAISLNSNYLNVPLLEYCCKNLTPLSVFSTPSLEYPILFYVCHHGFY